MPKLKNIFFNYKKSAKLFLIFILILSFCLMLIFSYHAVHPHHKCAGNACPVCLAANLIRSVLSILTAVSAVYTVAIRKKPTCDRFSDTDSFSRTGSPVSLMNVIIS